ncbi:MAG: ATP-binding cassette domain-containing protein [Chloroflexota bacterium]
MDSPAIVTRHLAKSYPGLVAVKGLDLSVARGEIFGLVGADGAGKTTTIRMLATLLAPSGGTATVLGLDVLKQVNDIKARIGYMSEHFNLYPTLTVEENLDFFIHLRHLPRPAGTRRKEELLRFCHLEAFRQRPAEHLSGGMQKKLALACSLIHEPELLFLDEPTTGVDPISRRDFWRIISEFLSRGITVVVSTPYLDEAERFNRVALMHRGEIIASDSPHNLKAALAGELMEIRARPVRQALTVLKQTGASPQLFGDTIHVLVAPPQKGRRLGPLLEQSGIAVSSLRQITPSLEDVFVNRLTTLETGTGHDHRLNSPPDNPTSPPAQDGTAIAVADLGRDFGAFTAVNRVNFEIKRGEIFGLLGPNGSGKTTAIRMMTGLLPPTRGQARVLGYDMSREADTAQARIGYMSQKFSLFPDLTVVENIRFYGGLYGLSASRLAARKNWVLDMAGLRGKEGVLPRELSGGWKQRLALGCTILHEPEVIFLDEPTAGVDPLSRRSFWGLIDQLAGQGATILVTTHYLDEAEHCHRLGLMHQGELIALGSPRELKEKPVEGELIEVVSPDYIRTLERLTQNPRCRQVNLFGSTLHAVVDRAETAIPELEAQLGQAKIAVTAIQLIPFTLEDVFIALIEK